MRVCKTNPVGRFTRKHPRRPGPTPASRGTARWRSSGHSPPDRGADRGLYYRTFFESRAGATGTRLHGDLHRPAGPRWGVMGGVPAFPGVSRRRSAGDEGDPACRWPLVSGRRARPAALSGVWRGENRAGCTSVRPVWTRNPVRPIAPSPVTVWRNPEPRCAPTARTC